MRFHSPCAPYKLPVRIIGSVSAETLPAHYPLPTDYRNHGVVLSPRIKFSAVALARICKPPFGRIPPITVIPPQRIWVEFHFEHSGMMLENTAGRSCSVLNRIILAAKGIQPMPNRRVWETCHFPNGANQIRTGDTGIESRCLTAWQYPYKPAEASAITRRR